MAKKNLAPSVLSHSFLGLLAWFSAVCCSSAPAYTYRPSSGETGRRTVEWADGSIILGHPEMMDFDANRSGRKTVRVIHLQVLLCPGGASRWVFEKREQLLRFPSGETESPFYSSPNKKIEIIRGKNQILDLYYRLPPRFSSPKDLSSFDLNYKISGRSGQIHFSRAEAQKSQLQSQLQTYAGYLPPVEPAHGPGYGEDTATWESGRMSGSGPG